MKIVSIKKFCYLTGSIFNRPKMVRALQGLAALSIISLAPQAFATDILAGTQTMLVDTLNGTGKTYLYIGECIISLLAYIQSKNIMVLLGIIVVAIFFNVMLSVSGTKTA